jgi:hypothetical protein
MRFLWSLLLVLFVAACSHSGGDLDAPPAPLGDFRLGHNIVVAPNLRKEALGRSVEKEQVITAMEEAIEARFGRYEGEALYHFGINVEQYFLAPRGVPVVGSPKSIMGFVMFVKEDATGENLAVKVKHFIVFESFSENTVLGSGWMQNAQKQLNSLAQSAAKEIELYLVKNHKENGWFGPQIATE